MIEVQEGKLRRREGGKARGFKKENEKMVAGS